MQKTTPQDPSHETFISLNLPVHTQWVQCSGNRSNENIKKSWGYFFEFPHKFIGQWKKRKLQACRKKI